MSVDKILVNERDLESFERLANCVRAGKAVALVGAGFSARVGYPSWDALLDRMEQRLSFVRERVHSLHRGATQKLPENLRKFDDVLWRGEEYRERLGETEYLEMLTAAFSTEPGTDPCLDALVRLPFHHILTTNYDKALEVTHARLGLPAPTTVNWADDEKVLELMFSFLEHERPTRYLIYLHGCISDPKTIILTDRDYTQRYLRSDAAVKKLFAIFAMQRIVIFGFSLSDPDLMAILRQVTGALGFQSPRHFAFIGMQVNEEREIDRRRLRTKFGIEAIFYDKVNRHEQLRHLMDELLRRCGREADTQSPKERAASFGDSQTARQVLQTGAVDDGVPSAGSSPSPEDPHKGQFGGLPARDGRQLSAIVREIPEDPDWFTLTLVVSASTGAPPLTGAVTFYLHPTFEPNAITLAVDNQGEARLQLVSYGAFTVGAITDGGAVRLELDLAANPSLPERFRLR